MHYVMRKVESGWTFGGCPVVFTLREHAAEAIDIMIDIIVEQDEFDHWLRLATDAATVALNQERRSPKWRRVIGEITYDIALCVMAGEITEMQMHGRG